MSNLKKSIKVIYSCQSCGYQSPKWMGKCPDCNQWDTLIEEKQSVKGSGGGSHRWSPAPPKPISIDKVALEEEIRLLSGIDEFDRVLGGGIVSGSLVLIGGEPGIGKSTLMIQALHGLAARNHTVLYVSGEESIKQITLRSKRLATLSPNLLIISEIDLESIMAAVEDLKPDVVVVDSIQTMFSPDLTSAPGSVTQVREAALRLMLMAKRTATPTFLVGHVTKEGAIAGPRLLEHMVDTVLYFEGDGNHVFRILRAVKNRFGSTNEIGVFEMRGDGLNQVRNPSAIFLAERPEKSPGSVVTCTMEGSRPILVELQALTSSTTFGTPRRTILGLDGNRVALLTAVIEKKIGFHLMGHDVFMNVAGGVKIGEPAVDMGIVVAVSSSFLDRPVPDQTVVLGEVGLTGEVRAVGRIEPRISEIKKMGFKRCIVPAANLKRTGDLKAIEIIGVQSIQEAVDLLF